MKKWIAASAVLLLAGCSDSPSEPRRPNLTGQWAYSATNISGGGVSCDVVGVTLNLTQSGSTFSGSATGGVLTCRAGGESVSVNLTSAVVANGSINGNQVVFDIDTSDWRNTGTLSGNSMSGVVNVRIDMGAPIGVILLSGNFSAVRQ
ncbi:MAG TPA: hypothetical protein VIL18_01845 [Longimicrobiales bacterium]